VAVVLAFVGYGLLTGFAGEFKTCVLLGGKLQAEEDNCPVNWPCGVVVVEDTVQFGTTYKLVTAGYEIEINEPIEAVDSNYQFNGLLVAPALRRGWQVVFTKDDTQDVNNAPTKIAEEKINCDANSVPSGEFDNLLENVKLHGNSAILTESAGPFGHLVGLIMMAPWGGPYAYAALGLWLNYESSSGIELSVLVLLPAMLGMIVLKKFGGEGSPAKANDSTRKIKCCAFTCVCSCSVDESTSTHKVKDCGNTSEKDEYVVAPFRAAIDCLKKITSVRIWEPRGREKIKLNLGLVIELVYSLGVVVVAYVLQDTSWNSEGGSVGIGCILLTYIVSRRTGIAMGKTTEAGAAIIAMTMAVPLPIGGTAVCLLASGWLEGNLVSYHEKLPLFRVGLVTINIAAAYGWNQTLVICVLSMAMGINGNIGCTSWAAMVPGILF
jgi:hypothetical protein